MIKVLHSELQSNIGGIESFLLNLTKSMDMTNIHFDMLMKGNNPYLENELKGLGVTIYKVPADPLQYSKFVKKLLKENNYDFVYVHKNSAANILLPVMVKKYSHAKLIVHSHNTSPSGGSKIAIVLHKFNRKKLCQLSDYRFACSDTAAEWMFGKDYQSKNVKIIKNGIITQDYVYNPEVRVKTREQLGLKGKFVIGHVGAFREQKNHKFLLKIFSKLDDPNAVLILIGDGVLKPEIQKSVQNMGLADRVLFLGTRHDIANLLQACDVFVMPSLWEGLSVAAIEAQASGLETLLSANVSKEVKVTNLVKFINLSDINEWETNLRNIAQSSVVRKNVGRKIEVAGFDMKNSAQFLKKIFES
ncbi:glycosyltransferase [Lactobacillus crispatus]|uniref:Glycosyltransferase family 1 protein n=1 Tax=Lactobacillus crispatus TaxID=47770 RepID=A0A5M9YZZ3_9LACO|nr:glycosyltransferase [Lactobacillus crispatus]KAA8812056.1 glycosyltransferase family 1 protein [Lactobacillus crispatus]KRK35693.1 hypothetical protein FC28_GL001413 [Lactobacillus crispatus DSM 20584 = JCM 1185 = ATCC 33820]MBW9142367.1 glycosyltransferase [Lactobacillus crispatus]ORE87702.1 hypothetical protein B6C82_01795 [Lactobacillus crispatus]QWW28783.1 glycosyltransferase [Lactobacillus crispatus]